MKSTEGLEEFTRIAAPFLRKDMAAAVSAAEEAGADLGLLSAVASTGPLPLTTRKGADLRASSG